MSSKTGVSVVDGVRCVDLLRGGRLRNVATPDACTRTYLLLTDAIDDDARGMHRSWENELGGRHPPRRTGE